MNVDSSMPAGETAARSPAARPATGPPSSRASHQVPATAATPEQRDLAGDRDRDPPPTGRGRGQQVVVDGAVVERPDGGRRAEERDLAVRASARSTSMSWPWSASQVPRVGEAGEPQDRREGQERRAREPALSSSAGAVDRTGRVAASERGIMPRAARRRPRPAGRCGPSRSAYGTPRAAGSASGRPASEVTARAMLTGRSPRPCRASRGCTSRREARVGEQAGQPRGPDPAGARRARAGQPASQLRPRVVEVDHASRSRPIRAANASMIASTPAALSTR